MNKLQKYVKVTNLYWPKNEKNAQKYEKGVKTRMPYRPTNFEKIVKYVSTQLHRLKNKKKSTKFEKVQVLIPYFNLYHTNQGVRFR